MWDETGDQHRREDHVLLNVRNIRRMVNIKTNEVGDYGG
jgi:hypothetical protein